MDRARKAAAALSPAPRARSHFFRI